MIDDTLLDAEEKMDKAVAVAKEDFSGIRTGRATSAMFNKIVVDYYGAMTPVNQLASLQVPEPRMAIISPYDKSSLGIIERAIRECKLGLNPAAADRSIRVPIPELSEERRRDMVKMIKQLAEEAKVRLRAARKEGMDSAKKMKADNAITEDGQKDFEKEVQELTNKNTKKIEDHAVAKEADLMKV